MRRVDRLVTAAEKEWDLLSGLLLIRYPLDLIACGGDGTVNAVAKLGLDMGIPMGILPIGRYNNVASSLYGKLKESEIIERLFLRTPEECATFCNRYLSLDCNAFTLSAGVCYLRTACPANGEPRSALERLHQESTLPAGINHTWQRVIYYI